MPGLKRKAVLGPYFVILLLLVGVIELRNCAAGRHPGVAGRFPLLAAAYNWLFQSERMHYVAAVDLKTNHKIQPGELTPLDPSLSDYLPSLDTLVGKYLKKDLSAGKPLLSQNLADTPTLKPDSNQWMITVRVTADPRAEKKLQPDSTIALVLPSSDKLEGKIVSTSLDIPSPKKTPGTETQKNKDAANHLPPSPSATPEQ